MMASRMPLVSNVCSTGYGDLPVSKSFSMLATWQSKYLAPGGGGRWNRHEAGPAWPVGGDRHVFEPRVQRQFQLRPPPGDRQAGAGQQRELQLLRPAVHLLRLGPAIREVLVVEDRAGLAGLAKDLDDLLHHLV